MDYPMLFVQGIAGMPAHCWRSLKLPGAHACFPRGAGSSPPHCLLWALSNLPADYFPSLWAGCMHNGYVLKQLGMCPLCHVCTNKHLLLPALRENSTT